MGFRPEASVALDSRWGGNRVICPGARRWWKELKEQWGWPIQLEDMRKQDCHMLAKWKIVFTSYVSHRS